MPVTDTVTICILPYIGCFSLYIPTVSTYIQRYRRCSRRHTMRPLAIALALVLAAWLSRSAHAHTTTLTRHADSVASPSPCSSVRSLFVWFCLELCPSISVSGSLAGLSERPIAGVSFERYSLADDGSFMDFSARYNLTDIRPLIPPSMGQWPLISSYPHKPQFIDAMRLLFSDPAPFINAAVSEAMSYGYRGYNLDFEPTAGVSASDALAYAQFIGHFATALQQRGLRLTVDVASWGPIWNFTALASVSGVCYFTMDTYSNSSSSFARGLAKAVDAMGPTRVVAGFDGVDSALDGAQVSERLGALSAAGVSGLSVWAAPVSVGWWPAIEGWLSEEQQEQFIEI